MLALAAFCVGVCIPCSPVRCSHAICFSEHQSYISYFRMESVCPPSSLGLSLARSLARSAYTYCITTNSCLRFFVGEMLRGRRVWKNISWMLSFSRAPSSCEENCVTLCSCCLLLALMTGLGLLASLQPAGSPLVVLWCLVVFW